LTWRRGIAELLVRAGACRNLGSSESAAESKSEAVASKGGAAASQSGAAEGVTFDEMLYDRLKLLSLHGQDKDARAKAEGGGWEYDIVAPWYKCNMTDVAAALGASQLLRYPQTLARRQELVELYTTRLEADALTDGYKLDILAHRSADGALSSGHLMLVRLLGQGDAFRRRFIQEMADLEVPCNVHYKPLPLLSAYRDLGFSIDDYPHALAQYLNEVTLPLHTMLSDEDVQFVCDSFRTAYATCRQEFNSTSEASEAER